MDKVFNYASYVIIIVEPYTAAWQCVSMMQNVYTISYYYDNSVVSPVEYCVASYIYTFMYM